METKELKIKVATRKTTDGRTFNTYKTFSKNGRATDVKFRKEVKNLPEKDCYIVVDVDDMNLNTAGEFPIVWIKAIQEIKEIGAANVENNRKKIEDYFG